MISSPERDKFEQLDIAKPRVWVVLTSAGSFHMCIHTFPGYLLGTLVFWLALCLVGTSLSRVTRSGDLSALQTREKGASPLGICASPLKIRTWTKRPLTFRKISASKARGRNKRIFSFKGQSQQLLKRYFQIGLLGCDRVCV